MGRPKKETVEAKEVLTPEDTRRLKEYVDASISMFREIDDRREAQGDLAKTLADEFGWKPNELKKIAKTAYKGTLRDEEQQMDRVSSALALIGRGLDSEED